MSPFSLARAIAPERLRPLRRTEYEQLAATGAFQGERVELLAGKLVTMSPRGTRHSETVSRLTKLLVPRLLGRAEVRVQDAFAASDESEPEPDVAVVPAGDYSRAHPVHALLLVEVSDSSLADDLGIKLEIYQESRVEEYWVVDLTRDQVLVHQRTSDGRFAAAVPRGRGQSVAPQAFPELALAVNDLLAG